MIQAGGSIGRIRRDSSTAERQLRFLDTPARTRSVTRAAEAVSMSRESAYRLRARRETGPCSPPPGIGH